MFTIGTDIEVFGKLPNGNHKALCGLIGGTKEEPKQILELPSGFMVQEDNVSLEFNVPPTTSRTQFVEYIGTMNQFVQKTLKELNLEISKNSSFIFTKEELKHPNALVFGCEPDFDAWRKTENKKPHAKNECLRTAGGHVHVGIDNVDMIKGIRAMDLFLGVPSILLDDSPESQQRRELYGKAGAMRPKPYGFEYRVLSNFWMFEDRFVAWVFDATAKAMNFCIHEKEITKEFGNLIQKCINESDKELAKKLINVFQCVMPEKEYTKPMTRKLRLDLPNFPITSASVLTQYYQQFPDLLALIKANGYGIANQMKAANNHLKEQYADIPTTFSMDSLNNPSINPANWNVFWDGPSTMTVQQAKQTTTIGEENGPF